MADKHDLPKLLTDAQHANPTVLFMSRSRTLTNTHELSYAERYRSFTGVWETPEENLQRAAEAELDRPATD